MKDVNKQYSNGEITVHWQSACCCHTGICVGELPQVFDVTQSPWVNINGASTEEIIRTVSRCPTGALTFTYNEKK